MLNNNKKVFAIIIITLFFFFTFIKELLIQNYYVNEIISPTEILLDNGKKISLDKIETFDAFYSERNKILAEKIGISEDEAFIIGNLAYYWTQKYLLHQNINILHNELIFKKFNYKEKLKYSSFGIIDGKPSNNTAVSRLIKSVRKGNYVIVNIDTDEIFPVSKDNSEKYKNIVVVRKNHVKFLNYKNKKIKTKEKILKNKIPLVLETNGIKILLSDFSTKLKPDRNCTTDICKEILNSINEASETIDIAIYGYSSVPKIETSIVNALKRGVKIRLVYDLDNLGNNIYPDTYKLVDLIKNNKSDFNSPESKNIMHNKFYIFDNKKVITGSANLSHTDLSGYNTNSVVIFNSPQIAEIYRQEFDTMFSGKFHNDKKQRKISPPDNLKIKFSPQDKGIENVIIPLIKQSKKYIYIPAFILTNNKMSDALIEAHKKGVEIKIILDALNTSQKHSVHNILRQAGIAVKTENYAGKMHSKSIIVDDKYVIIGSMNFSNSGETKNDENFVLIENEQCAKFYKQFFLYLWNKIPDKWLKYNVRAESFDSIGSCFDGIDNNYDGLIDSEDEGCKNK